MRDFFNMLVNPLFKAEKALKELGIAYEKRDDGTLFVTGDIDLKSKELNELPDLSRVVVAGDFNCTLNELTSLKGAPKSVGGSFYCTSNKLTPLEHAPQFIGGMLNCGQNKLVTLKGAPHSVGGSFFCDNNLLATLEYAPRDIGGKFSCASNKLTSLEFAPLKFPPNESFDCSSNKLTTLEFAPQVFRKLYSDFGEFAKWANIPEKLRPALGASHQRRIREMSEAMTTLTKPVTAPKRARFRSKPVSTEQR